MLWSPPGERCYGGRIGLYLSKELGKQIHQSWENIPQHVCGQRKPAWQLKGSNFPQCLEVPLNSDTSGLRQASFIYFRSGLAEPCQGFCERVHDLQAPSLRAPRVLSIPPRLVTPHGTWGSTPDPVSLRCHEKSYPQPGSGGRRAERGEDRTPSSGELSWLYVIATAH